MTQGSFAFKFSSKLYASDPLLTVLPPACQFSFPEVVPFASANPSENRFSVLQWL